MTTWLHIAVGIVAGFVGIFTVLCLMLISVALAMLAMSRVLSFMHRKISPRPMQIWYDWRHRRDLIVEEIHDGGAVQLRSGGVSFRERREIWDKGKKYRYLKVP